MITTVNRDGQKKLSISIKNLSTLMDLQYLRDAIIDVVGVITSNEETKESVNFYSMYWLTSMLEEITLDIDDVFKKGGEV